MSAGTAINPVFKPTIIQRYSAEFMKYKAWVSVTGVAYKGSGIPACYPATIKQAVRQRKQPENGGPSGIRTLDQEIKSLLLYQLS